jgi:hypothetical protein
LVVHRLVADRLSTVVPPHRTGVYSPVCLRGTEDSAGQKAYGHDLAQLEDRRRRTSSDANKEWRDDDDIAEEPAAIEW